MIVKLSKKSNSLINKKILILIGILLIIITIILLILINSEIFKESDLKITNGLQNSLINTKNNSISIFMEIVHFFNNIHFPYVVIAIIFNFYTIYDCFILVNILSIDYIISFCLKLIYFEPPYHLGDKNHSDEVKVYYCGYGWGFPSEECIIMASFYLSIWKIIISKYSINNKQTEKIIKYTLLAAFILLLIINSFGILLMGYYYLSHIMFSILTGTIVYLFILQSNFIDLLNGNDFISFIKDKYLHYLIAHLSIFVLLSFFFIIERFIINNNTKYDICKSIENKKIFSKSGKYSYIDGNYAFVILFLGNIFAMLGIIIDVKWYYGENLFNYYQFNFPEEPEETIDNNDSKGSRDSFNGSINITRETIWNKTPLLISVLRLIVILLFFGVCFIPYFLVNLTDSNTILILIIKLLLPTIFFFLGIFFYFKPILIFMKLTNFTLESILEDK